MIPITPIEIMICLLFLVVMIVFFRRLSACVGIVIIGLYLQLMYLDFMNNHVYALVVMFVLSLITMYHISREAYEDQMRKATSSRDFLGIEEPGVVGCILSAVALAILPAVFVTGLAVVCVSA